MPRRSRIISNTGIYHALLRGINQQRIFEDESDYEYFQNKLGQIKNESGVFLLSYCFLSNHVHLLLQEGESSIEHLFRRLLPSYAYYFNQKYSRSGHLFQDRYKSEPVQDDTYLTAVINYINQNPVEAGICRNAVDYKWGSLNTLGREGSIVDEERLFSLITKNEIQTSGKPAKEISPFREARRGRKASFSDEEAVLLMGDICGAKDASQFQRLAVEQQMAAVRALGSRGVSIRQIARIGGTSKGLVERWVKTIG